MRLMGWMYFCAPTLHGPRPCLGCDHHRNMAAVPKPQDILCSLKQELIHWCQSEASEPAFASEWGPRHLSLKLACTDGSRPSKHPWSLRANPREGIRVAGCVNGA